MESKHTRLQRIESHHTAQTCSICKKHLDYADGYYSDTHAHYDCAFPVGYKSPVQQMDESIKKVDSAPVSPGVKPKRQKSSIGEGAPTKKLMEIIEVSAKENFGVESVTGIRILLPPPVWRQARFDVMRVEGSMKVDGRSISFGSWISVSELIKYRQLKWDGDWPSLDMSPVYETKRTRSKAKNGNNQNMA